MIRILKAHEVSTRVALTREYLYVLERRGEFPRRVQITPNRIGWLESEVDDWLKERIARRDSNAVRGVRDERN